MALYITLVLLPPPTLFPIYTTSNFCINIFVHFRSTPTVKMKSFFTVTLAALASATALLPRDATTIVNDINHIGDLLTSLDSSVKGFSGDSTAALAIQTAAQDLEKAIESATSDISGNGNLSDDDSGLVANAVLALQTPIQNALSDIVAAKAGLNNALPGASSIVSGDLTTLKSDTDALGKALVAILTPTYASLAPQILSQIDGEFDTAISAYADGGSSPTSAAATSAAASATSAAATSEAVSSKAPASSEAPASSAAATSEAAATSTGAAAPTKASAAASSSAAAAAPTKAAPTTKTNGTSATAAPATYTGAANKITSYTFGSAVLMVLGLVL